MQIVTAVPLYKKNTDTSVLFLVSKFRRILLPHHHIGERPREYRDRFQKERGYLHTAAISLILFRTISISSLVPMVIRI